MGSAGTALTQHTPEARVVYRRRLRLRSDFWIGLTLSILGFITFVPVLMLIELSLKKEQQMADSMWLPTYPFHWVNYSRAIRIMAPYMVNSLVYVIGEVTLSIVCATLTAYALARYTYPGKEFLFMAILALMMIPGILTLLARFVVVMNVKLYNTYWGIWLPMAAGAQAFQIVVLRTFFESVPEELFEAGRLDGARESWMLLQIALPLAKPILTTLIILQANGAWNEFVWPMMIFKDPERYPAIVGILRLRQIFFASHDPGAEHAGYVIAALPLLILFTFSSRAFIRGLTSGAIKM